MMTNLLNGAHVANKLFSTIARLRLLLVMFLTLTVTTNAWGADYTLVTSNTNLNNGDKVIIATKNSSGKPNTGVTGQDGDKDAIVSTTESNWVQYIVGSASTSGWTLYDSGQDKYIAQPTGNHFKYSTTAGTCFVNNNGVLGCNSRYLQANGTNYRMYSGINNSYTPFYVWKVSASYTVTATSNNNNYGTVSVTGTTITATPNDCYQVVSGIGGYTIESGTATVTHEGNSNTLTVNASTDCSIQVNFERKPVNTYIDNVHNNESVELCGTHDMPSLSDKTAKTEGTCEELHWHFMGWVTEANKENPTDVNIIAPNTSVDANEATYYAVWAKGTETNGGNVETTITIPNETLIGSLSGSYGNKSFSYEGYTFYLNACVQSSYCQMRDNTTISFIQIPTLPGPITKISCTDCKNASNSAYTGTLHFKSSKTRGNSDTDDIAKITYTSVNSFEWEIDNDTHKTGYLLTSAGLRLKDLSITYITSGETTTYSDYITQCTTEPSPSLSADETELAFNEVTVDSSKELEFTLSGSNLTADAILALSGTNADLFSVSQTSVTPTDGSITDQTITVTYTPDAKASHFATLTISSTDAAPIQISLSGTGVAQTAEYNVEHYRQNIVDDEYTLCETETSYGEVDAFVTPAVKTYEGFTAPPTQTVTILSDGSTTVKYQYTRNSYTLTWNVNGGNALTGDYTSGSVKYEATITKPTDPTREGYTFADWSPEVAATMPAANTTYIAQWTEKTAPNISWSAPACTVTIASPSNELPTLNNPNSLSPIDYSSSATEVAIIDDQGRIILKSAGETTITAAFTETEDYKSAEVTYTLTVVESNNCRWIETDIEDIEYGDEVVVAMETATGTYALNSENGTTSAPPATSVTVTNKEITSSIQGALMWFIEKDGNNLIFHPITDPSKNLYCNTSDNNNRVRVGSSSNATINHKFIISGNHLQNSITNHYLGIYYSNGNAQDWRGYANSTQFAGQTLKFYKRVCLSEGQYWVKWMVAGQEYTAGDPTTFTDGTITAIPDAPDDNTLADCGATKFMGWSESNLGSAEGQAAPTDLFTTLAEAQELTITEDKTFYAVFATTEGSSAPTQYTAGDEGSFVLAAKNGNKWYALPTNPTVDNGKITGSEITVTTTDGVNHVTTANASGYIWTIANATNGQTISDGSKYIYHSNGGASGTNLSYGTSVSYEWTITKENDGLSFKAIGGNKDDNRGMLVNGTKFGGYALSNEGDDGYYRISVLPISDGVSYSNYVTNCCATPAPTNGTFDNVTGSGNTMSLTLNWEGSASRYHITGGNLAAEGVYTSETSYPVNNLTECEEYTFNITAYPAEGCESAAIQISAQPFSGAKTVNYNYNGGSGSPASFTTSCDDDKREIILPVATRPGYTFDGWYDSEENKVGVAGATYDPATSPITLYAHWTENIYQLTHNGSNYTFTENKTSIKSSETPFTLQYTCTGDYGLPATISITGGGKSWTVNTDYTWEVAADKQSATLEIKETVISADVTITINVATRYTVTFVHNDKGVFTGSETLEVLSSENTITLPTVTDVSCGFYDTFEGWIVANEDYTESTSKPAGTIYKGGANYTVNGDCTLRALYSKCEGDATQVYRKVTTIDEVTNGIYILVSNNPTPYVYSGHGDGNDYANIIDGLIADGDDYSTLLPSGAVQLTVTRGTGANASQFTIQNGTKYFKAGSDIALQDAVSWWQLTTGEQVNSKNCPAGALQPVNATTYVMQQYQSSRFKTYQNTQSYYVFLYKLIDKCTKYYSTNPSCEKPVGVYIFYNANAADADMSCKTQNRTYKVVNDENQYPQLASQLQFCTDATREGYTLVGWNTQANGQGTTYNINQPYSTLRVSGELDGEKKITLNLYAMWKPCIKFNIGNAIGGTGVPDVVVENEKCVLPTPTAEQLGTIPCGYEFYAWSETSVLPTQTKPALFMPGDTYTGSALTLYAVYRWCEGNTGSDTYYFTFIDDDKTYCITQKHNNYDRFVVEEATSGLIFGLENGYLYYLDEGVKTFVYWEGSSTTVTTTTTYPNADTQKTTFVEGDNGTTIVTPAISGRYLQMPSSSTDRAYYTTGEINPTLVEVQTTTCTYATNPTCYTNTNLHFVTNGGTLNYPTDYNETNYQELAIGDDILLPTATFAGEWTFEGWKRGSQLESQTIKPYDPSFYPVTPNSTLFEVDELGDIYFYAVYSKTNDDKQFDPVNGGTYKLFAIGADDTKTYMPIWNGGRGTMSGVTTCAETGDYTITPGTDTHAGQYQITCGEYTLGVVSGGTDLNEVEGTWWNIEPSTSGKGTWRITVVGSSDRALSCLFSTAKSFGNYAISNLNNSSQPIYRDMEIGECIYTEYTSTPENIPYITITGAPVKITSTNGERVYAPTTLHIEAHNFTGERIIHLSATNGFGVYPEQVRTNGQGAYSGDVKVYYEPTADGDGQTITTSVFTASQTGGNNDEKISQTFTAIQGRNMPANFVIAAKWDGLWYALPANCTTSNSSTEGLLIEVDDVDNPTRATQAPASAKYGIREVIPSRQTDHGHGVVFTERYSEGNMEYSLYNNGTSANIQVYSQYSNYAATNPERYEWTPSTTDFVEYTLTNANSSRKITLNNSGVFSATTASGQVRLLQATFYEPAPVQVLKWKENSVIVMYTGAETTATTQVGTNPVSAAQTLENQKLTHGIYELTTAQALTGYARDVLVLYFGANTKVEMEIPLIVSGNVTASANGHDVVVLENSKLTAAADKYSFQDVYVYGGGKLAVPASTSLGVNNIILRAGGIATNGAGEEATYQYIYPQVELKGTLSSTKTDIKYEYVTDYDHWYHFVLPFNGNIKSITYPTEYYGDHVALDNTGSWVIKRYDGATRATGNYNAWVDIESEAATTTTAGKGYIFWGAPKKVSVNGGTKVRQQWGIQRITMPITSAAKAVEAETGDKTIEDLGSYANVANNSGAVNDQGWNLIGNPYMVNLTTMAEDGLKAGKLEKEIVDGNWTGKWINNGDGIRYLTIPSNHFDTYEAKTVYAATTANNLVPGRAFFVQLEGEANGITFAAANRASLMPALLAENSDKLVDIETGIILSNETLQDEVNFWIKDGKTNDYEYNADYPKTPNNNRFNIYGVHTNGDLSWVAISPELAAESMPIGYQVPAAGTYMLSLSETYYSEDLESLYVTDHEMSPEVTVDLINAPYEFSVNQAETNNERFTISLKLKSEIQGPTTGWENIDVGKDHPTKFIHQDRLYILRDGVIYDATGQEIQTINK